MSKFDYPGCRAGRFTSRHSLSWHGWFPRGYSRYGQHGEALGIGAPGGMLQKPYAEAVYCGLCTHVRGPYTYMTVYTSQ